ncbi:MAG: MMPL family transporter [Verrucomicrobiota bacterium]|jgi:predicted exporter/lauroyl/myristoyl acyltransferase
MTRWLGRWWWALLAVPLAAGLWRVRLDTEVLNLLPGGIPVVRGLQLYQKHFTNARELILTVRAADAESAETAARRLAEALRRETNLVASVVWQPPWLEHPEDMVEFIAYLWLNQPPAPFAELTNRLAPDRLAAVAREARDQLATSMSPAEIARLSYDPFGLTQLPGNTLGGAGFTSPNQGFASADGTFRVIYVQARTELGNYRECSEWLKSVQAAVGGVRTNASDGAGVTLRYTGRPVFVSEIAAAMQRDLSGSVTGTALIIALLFWLTHRRWLPMLWLLALLAMILVATVGLGGLLLGSIGVVSLGFAAVLLGLAVDYAVVHYQEALSHPQLSVPEIRRAIAPSILWAAITTIAAFLVLNLGGLPGLAQLGSLVAIGVALAALVMVMLYLPPLFRERRKPPVGYTRPAWWTFLLPPPQTLAAPAAGAGAASSRLALGATVFLIILAGAVLCVRFPRLDRTANALRPPSAGAETALQEVTAALGLPKDPLWVVVAGPNESAVGERLTKAESWLQQAQSNHIISGSLLPVALWPNPENQMANRATARVLGTRGPLMREAAARAGFATNALFLTDELVRAWARTGESTGVVWPTNDLSRWILKQFVARSTNEWFAMGLVQPPANRVALVALADLSGRMAADGVLLSGWELLGTTTLRRVQERMWLVLLPMVLLVLVSLGLAFRRAVEVLLGLAVLLLSALCLAALMALAGWSWNLLNLMALPLMLGTGVDYGIFMQLALRRHGGDVRAVRRSIGRALLLCGGTAVVGFGSLAWSSNAGMASLGRVCAVGIGANMLIAVYLLPAWWVCCNATERLVGENVGRLARPSATYGPKLWRLGLFAVRGMPRSAGRGLGFFVALAYRLFRPERFRVVEENLLPVVADDRRQARSAARKLLANFVVKIIELLRHESGASTEIALSRWSGYEIFVGALSRRQGVLLVTPHLGNWETGGFLLGQKGVRLLVLTQPEPGRGFTELRQQARARWGIETLVVGQDAFAFVEVIKRLRDGAIVALLMDRPPPASAVTVELFGRPFQASIAPAELARAAGCALVPVYIVADGKGYAAHVLPEIAYDRPALGDREARRRLTAEIMRAFEPAIRQHADQWYHFVPVWPKDGTQRS